MNGEVPTHTKFLGLLAISDYVSVFSSSTNSELIVYFSCFSRSTISDIFFQSLLRVGTLTN